MSGYWKGVNEGLHGSVGDLSSVRVTGKPPVCRTRQRLAGSVGDLPGVVAPLLLRPSSQEGRPTRRRPLPRSLEDLSRPAPEEEEEGGGGRASRRPPEQRLAFRPSLRDWGLGEAEEPSRGTETRRLARHAAPHLHNVRPGLRPTPPASTTPRPPDAAMHAPPGQSVENLPFRQREEGFPSERERDQRSLEGRERQRYRMDDVVHLAKPAIVVDITPAQHNTNLLHSLQKEKNKEAVKRQGRGSNNNTLRSEVKRIIETKRQIQANLITTQDELRRQLKDLRSRMQEQEHQWAEERANKDGLILSQKSQIDRMAKELKDSGNRSHQEDELRRQLKDLRSRMQEQEHQWAEERANKDGLILSQKSQIDRMATELKDSGNRSHPGHLEPALVLGLPNLGNTSYINSVIQCLFNVYSLRLYFIQDCYKRDLNRESPQRGEVAKSFAQVFNAIESGVNVYSAMKNFKQVVETQEKLFQMQNLPKPHDLLSCLLTWLHNDLLKPCSQRQREHCYDGMDRGGSSVISSLFHGQTESIIYCPNKEKIVSRAIEVFDTLSLPVFGDHGISVQELLDDFFRPRRMDDWNCQQCRRPHTCVQDQRLLSIPPILIMYFYRNSNKGRTSVNKSRVLLSPENLSLQEYTLTTDKQYPTYDLLSVCNDKGMGNYIACCRRNRSSNRWWVWNDKDLQETTTESLATRPDTNIVFYASTKEPFAL